MTYILYVARDKARVDRYHLGSALCLRALELLPRGVVEVHDCTRDPPEARPAWLTGTPTVVAASGGDVYRGHHALSHLQYLSVQTAASMSRKPTKAKEDAHGRKHQPAPEVQLRDEDAPRRHPSEAEDEEDPTSMPGLWDSGLGGHDDDEGDAAALPSSRKLTSDDLAKVVQSREMSAARPVHPGAGGASQPPPPPPLDDDA